MHSKHAKRPGKQYQLMLNVCPLLCNPWPHPLDRWTTDQLVGDASAHPCFIWNEQIISTYNPLLRLSLTPLFPYKMVKNGHQRDLHSLASMQITCYRNELATLNKKPEQSCVLRERRVVYQYRELLFEILYFEKELACFISD